MSKIKIRSILRILVFSLQRNLSNCFFKKKEMKYPEKEKGLIFLTLGDIIIFLKDCTVQNIDKSEIWSLSY